MIEQPAVTKSDDSSKEWQKTQYANLIRYAPSVTYFARLRVNGNLIRCTRITDASKIDRWDAQSVTFRYRENGRQQRCCTVSGEEFVRRFLQHVPPRGLQRVRHYGWLGAAAKASRERILALLGWQPPVVVKPAPVPPPKCPCCGKPMLLLGTLPRAPTGTRWTMNV